MSIAFSNSSEVFFFILLCSAYVCSCLWIYGDAATRDMGVKGAILPLVFIIAAALFLTLGIYWVLVVWPIGYIAWFILRPKSAHVIDH